MHESVPAVWRILLVDDDRDDYLLTRERLRETQVREISLDWAASYADGLKMIQSGDYHAVLVDYNLGAENGIDLIREVVRQGCPSPLILYSGVSNYTTDMAAMEVGATLFLSKQEATSLLLERSLRYAIERKQFQIEKDRLLKERSEILESIQDGFFSIDRNWQITYINQRAAQYGGVDPKHVVGKNIFEVFPRALGTPFEQHCRTVMEQRVPVQFEMQGVYQKNWYNMSVYPSADGISTYWLDISEKKKAEAALQESEERLRSITENAPGFIAELDLQGCFLYVNHDTPRYRADELLGASILKTIPIEYQAAVNDLLNRTASRGEMQTAEFCRNQDGKEFWQAVRFAPVIGPNGVERIIFIGTDITQQKQADAQLRDSEARFSHALDSLLDGFAIFAVVCDEQGRVSDLRYEYINKVGSQMIPAPKETYLGKR
jgi:PAS domain S-box-containing protein